MLLFVGLLVLAVGSAGRATALRHKPTRPATVVLHPKWHLVAPGGVDQVLVSGRYAYIGGDAGSGVLIDEQTGNRVTLAPPTGCYFDNGNSAALGGSWVVATCNPPPPGPRYLYELYSIPNATWMPFTPDVQQMFALNADCRTGDPQCGASFLAIGDRWIEFQITCGEHCGPTIAFQNIQSGQVDDQPTDWRPGGTEIPDLNSPTGLLMLCDPLQVPVGPIDPSTGQTLPGTIAFYGPFAIAQQVNGNNYYRTPYLERCGSKLHRLIDPRGWPFAANSHAAVWITNGTSSEIDGLFLPGLRRLVLRAPSGEVREIVLSSRRLYIESQGQVWSTASPRLPQKPR